MSIISKILPAARLSSATHLRPLIITPSLRRPYSSTRGGLTKARETADVSTDVRPLGEKIKETTKTVSYTGVILAGVGVTGIIFYYVFRELFSSNSPNNIYAKALEKCKNDPRIEDSLGAPIKGYGEETTRRRRTHVSHTLYDKNGVSHMRMRFHIQGCRKKGVVEVDVKQNDKGNYEFRYIIVQLDDYTNRVIIVEDNRADVDDNKSTPNIGLPAINWTQ